MTTAEIEQLPESTQASDRPDYTVRWLAAVAAVLSIGAYVYFGALNATLIYFDSIPHLTYARRLFESPTPGLGQLGSVWLPLPHLLMAPFAWIDMLYFSGLAGAVVSMASYVLTTVFLFKIAFSLTNNKFAGIVAALIFMANPNVLFLQSTPMTELLLFASISGMVYGVQRWIQTDQPRYLTIAGYSGLAGVLTRYEAWIVVFALVIVLFYTTWRRRGSSCAEGVSISFAWYGAIGVLLWCGWNWLIFGNPLNFLVGEYAKPSIWVSQNDPAIGHIWTAVQTYFFATFDNLGGLVSLGMVAGLVVIVATRRLTAKLLPTLAVLMMFPVFVILLDRGERPLHVLEVNGSLYNIRFGLMMILPAAILIGYLVSLLPSVRLIPVTGAIAVVLAVIAAANMAHPEQIITYQEPNNDRGADLRVLSKQTSDFLAGHYDGGTILMENFGNEFILHQAHLGTSDTIYEGSFRLWDPALADPAAQHIKWVIMRHSGLETQPDKVYAALYGKPQLADYSKVYENPYYYVYGEIS